MISPKSPLPKHPHVNETVSAPKHNHLSAPEEVEVISESTTEVAVEQPHEEPVVNVVMPDAEVSIGVDPSFGLSHTAATIINPVSGDIHIISDSDVEPAPLQTVGEVSASEVEPVVGADKEIIASEVPFEEVEQPVPVEEPIISEESTETPAEEVIITEEPVNEVPVEAPAEEVVTESPTEEAVAETLAAETSVMAETPAPTEAPEVVADLPVVYHYFHCKKPDGKEVIYKRNTASKSYLAEVEAFKKSLANQGIVILKEEVK